MPEAARPRARSDALTARPPAFRVPTTLAAWTRRRREIRRALQRLLGGTPPRPARVRAVTVARHRDASYLREDLLLDDGAGVQIPAVVLLPRAGAGPWPAICWHHSHWGDYAVGLEELFQPWPVRETPAVALTRRGYAVLAIDAWAFGRRQGCGPGGPGETGRDEETSLAKAFLWQGTSLWAMMVRDDLIALDYLAARPDVDARRIGATGMSMGSTRTWWLAALDERIAAAACVACLTRAQSLLAHGALRRHGIYYFLPHLLRHLDTEAVVSLIAPRPLLTLTGDRDGGSPADGVRTIQRACARVYALYGARDRFRGQLLPGVGHIYTPAMFRRVLAWLDQSPRAPAGARGQRRGSQTKSECTAIRVVTAKRRSPTISKCGARSARCAAIGRGNFPRSCAIRNVWKPRAESGSRSSTTRRPRTMRASVPRTSSACSSLRWCSTLAMMALSKVSRPSSSASFRRSKRRCGPPNRRRAKARYPGFRSIPRYSPGTTVERPPAPHPRSSTRSPGVAASAAPTSRTARGPLISVRM